jgi:SAM-dependent methyltransferase
MQPAERREPGGAASVGAERPTRGTGKLEALLARLRARQADRLIPTDLRSGRILDVGCGSYPYFLAHTEFEEKFAVDKSARPAAAPSELQWCTLDLHDMKTGLPFPSEHFDVVTMLAVIEHLDPDRLGDLLAEVRRVLRPRGVLILTTPAPWSDGLLRVMARLGLVSAEEIEEHQFPYRPPLIGAFLGAAGFNARSLRFGYFEAGLNLWAVAERTSPSIAVGASARIVNSQS